jgi:ubiquinone/menaquinone biosynthesis C-methylase UbiE
MTTRFDGAIQSNKFPLDFFSVDLVDLGESNPAYRGIYVPKPEVGRQRVGITAQFLENAEDYHKAYANYGHFSELFRRAFAALGLHEAHRILDIGTGSGVNTIGPLLAQMPGCAIVATDLSPDLLRMLRKYLTAESLEERVACVCTDALRDYFRPGSFNLVVGAAILHHLLDPVLALKSAYRALEPGGVAVWFEPFEPGTALLRLAYTLILRRSNELAPKTCSILRALALDTETRIGTDKSAPHFLHMDDKWLFTRSYVEAAAREAGFASVQILPHAVSSTLYRDIAAIQLRLAAGLPPDALPTWAWEVLDEVDRSFSDDAKREILHEGTILLKK